MFASIFAKKLPDEVTLADFAYAFSPLVEETAVNTVVIDVEGCELLFGSAYELANYMVKQAARGGDAGGLGCKVNVALAGNPDAAIHAARFFKGITFISPGEELEALGELPVEALLSPKSKAQSSKSLKTLDIGLWTLDEKRIQEILETLRLWGIRTFREFADLPTAGIAERLGQEGVRLQQLASGKTERHLKIKQAAPVFENSIELEHPLAELEPLSFILARLLNKLCASLHAYALATNELRIVMKLEDQTSHESTLNLPSPMRDHKVFLKLLLLDTEMHPPKSAVTSVSISCKPVKPRLLQDGLFIPLAPEPEKLELTLARLGKLVGAANVGSAELIDTYRSDAFLVKKFVVKTTQEKKKTGKSPFISSSPRLPIPASPCFSVSNLAPVTGFRVFRPPLRAIVEAGRGYPTQVSAWGANRSVHGKVVRLGGPWRKTGDWWLESRWARDEWDVTVESRSKAEDGHPSAPLQTLCRIYRELHNNFWFVEGIYD
jgi:protein ImuB